MTTRYRQSSSEQPSLFQEESSANDYSVDQLQEAKLRVYSKESLIDALRSIREQGWIANRRPGNSGGVGNTLEDLLGIDENNLPIPNAAEWELKTQRKSSNSLVTLFHYDPSPRSMYLIPQVLLPQYGWPHEEAGKKYPQFEMSFRQTLNGLTRTDRGFMLVVDRQQRKVAISFDATAVQPHHADWLEQVMARAGLGELKIQPYWGFDDLIHKVGTKLHNCFFVQAEVKRVNGVEWYWYSDIRMLQSLSTEGFINAIESGAVYIDFDACTHHNHGTKFRIREKSLPLLYARVTLL